MPLLRPTNLASLASSRKRLFDNVAIVLLCCLGIVLGAWEAYVCAKIKIGYIAGYSFMGAVALALVLVVGGVVLGVYWRTRRIAIGFVSAGVLSFIGFYAGIAVLTKMDRVAWRHEPRVAIGPDRVASVVIYFCPDTTSDEIENFRETVLEQDARPRHAGKDFPPFVASYLRIAKSQAHGHDGVALTFQESTKQEAITNYMTQIESDPRVANLFTNIAPTAIIAGDSSVGGRCR